MHSNRYTLMYAAAISVLTAIILAFLSESLKPAQQANIALDKQINILRSVHISNATPQQVQDIFQKRVQKVVVNSKGEELAGQDPDAIVLKDEVNKPAVERKLPLYIYTGDNGRKYYIIPTYGVGLWGPIWGYVALEDDFNTVYGATFDHKGETPGLGAEIADAEFQAQFPGKKIMSENNTFVSVRVVKPTDPTDYGAEHRVDGISGGTITSRGTDAMLKNCIEPYLTYFEKQKQTPPSGGK
ncbi:MAG: NADH:ubiquinone reductase (Na(+)-transporting) subunit C [Saprospiraceae bacterium]|nr:NADH:ubiquinone reductase (Na(+)-transporting) subunit C [Saprospiraceae bacterium]MDW8228662.1 NADH:ubiquinone reductase (Na(+)-transporting) subunit C [Saprospiraceae bacterium]